MKIIRYARLFAALLLAPLSGLAAPGDLDTTFGETGKVITPIGSGYDNATSVAVQSDGRILVAGLSERGGNTDSVLVRYNSDGSLDTTFNGTGKVVTDFGGVTITESVAIQGDGKILLGGYSNVAGGSDFVLLRYNADGTPDTAFNGTGKVTTDFGTQETDVIRSLAVQSDGKIVAAGFAFTAGKANFAVVRYNSDGSLDTTFNTTGRVTTAFGSGEDEGQSVTLQSDGKVVVCGYSFYGASVGIAVARYNSNGSLDTSFDGDGKVTTNIAGYDAGFSVALHGGEKILVAGLASPGDFALVRYNANGSLDTSFNGTGVVTTSLSSGLDQANGMAVQSDGKVVLAGIASSGSGYGFALVRYNADGMLDTSFNGTGKAITSITTSGDDRAYGVALQSDGNLVLVGAAGAYPIGDFGVVRYIGSDSPVVATGSPVNVTGTSATLAGTVNPNGTSTTAYFEYGTTTLYGSTTAVQNIPAGTAPVDVSAPVSGLSAGATYHFRLVAGNAGGTATGVDVSFVAMGTGGATAVPTAATGIAVSVTTQAATLEGMVNPKGGATLVQFEFGLTTSYTSATLAQSIGTGMAGVSVSAQLSGLMPGATYHYRVVGTNDLGTGQGVDRTFTTSAVAPVAATEPATNIGISFATLHGTVTPNDLAVTVSFEIAESEAALLAAAASPVAASPASLIAGITTPQAVTGSVSGLPPSAGGIYFYRIKATSGGTTVVGDPVSFTLQNTLPVARDDAFIILGDDSLDPIKQFTSSDTPGRDSDADPGDALKIVAVNAPTAAQFGTPVVSGTGLHITYDPGAFFAGSEDGDSFSYTIEDSRGGRATATVRVFHTSVLAGTYSGLIGTEGTGAAAGRLDITLTRTGQITGSFKWQGQLYSFKGATLGKDGTLTVTKAKIDGGGAVLDIALVLDPAAKILTGTLTDTATTPAIVARAEVTGTATLNDLALEDLPEPGIYVSYIDPGSLGAALAEGAPEAGAPVFPRGLGFSQITVRGKITSRSRPARAVGRMPDDQPFSSGARGLARALRAASGQARYPLFVDNLYPKVRDNFNRLRSGGVVSGDLAFTRSGARFDSNLNWERLANPRAPRFAGGIRGLRAALNAIKYGRPAPGNLPGGIVNDARVVNAKIDFRDGDLPGLITRSLKLTRSGIGPVRARVEPLNPSANVEMVKLTMDAAKGKFSGSFRFPGTNVLTKFNGVFKNADGQGVFTGPETTGRVQIQKVGE